MKPPDGRAGTFATFWSPAVRLFTMNSDSTFWPAGSKICALMSLPSEVPDLLKSPKVTTKLPDAKTVTDWKR